MAKSLQLDVIGNDRSARQALDSTADGLDKVADAADHADEQLRDAAEGSGRLSTEIAKTEQAVKRLTAEFDRTGDKGLFKQIAKQQRELNTMLKLRDQLEKPIEVGGLDDNIDESTTRFSSRLLASVSETGAKVSSRVAGILGDSVSNLPPQAQAGIATALVGGAAVAAPAIGATVSAALLTGVGGAGIGVGIAAAMQDPAVEAAIGGVGERLKGRLADALGDDFAAPTVQSVMRLEQAAGGLLDQVDDELSALAPVMVKVADGAGQMIERLGPGLADALEASAPVLEALGRELPELGDDISNFFSSVSNGDRGAVLALVAVLDGLGFVIRHVGDSLEVTSIAFEHLVGGTHEITSWARTLTNDIPLVGDAFDAVDSAMLGWMVDAGLVEGRTAGLSNEIGRLTAEQELATRAAAEHADKLDILAGAGQSVRMATLDFKDGLAELTDSVERNGTSLNVNSEKGRNNLRVVESLITAADRAGEAAEKRALAEGKSADEAAKAGAKMRTTYIADLEAAARKAGLSEQKIQDMVKELKQADGQRARMYVDVSVGRTVASAASAAVRAGAKAMSTGGPVGGDGPAGVDSQLIYAASDEWVATGRAHRALAAAFGADGLEQLNRTGALPGGAAAGAGGAAAGAASGPLEVVVRAILQWPDGSTVTEQVTRHANRSGLGSLEAVFGLPAVAG